MHCHRCENLMFPLDLGDWGIEPTEDNRLAWRCFACGEIVDQLIEANRARGEEHTEEWRKGGARRRVNAIGLLR